MVVEETGVSLSFRQWLASVTERINQTMHFQFDGKPEPLGKTESHRHHRQIEKKKFIFFCLRGRFPYPAFFYIITQ